MTEFMAAPVTPIPDHGEWVEVYNPRPFPIDLYHTELLIGLDRHLIAQHVIVGPADQVVLARKKDPNENGGLFPDYEFGGLDLDDESDTIALLRDNVIIDSVTYAPPGHRVRRGRSLSLDPGAYHTEANDNPSAWCSGGKPYASASDPQQGSPFLRNPACPPPVPPLWSCLSLYWSDGSCDCGCGAPDVDCTSSGLAACAYCAPVADGGCNGDRGGACPGTVDPENPAVCASVAVPSAWTCAPQAYAARDGCDCGCGVPDPDCTGSSVVVCTVCNAPGSCSVTPCPGTISASDNASCL